MGYLEGEALAEVYASCDLFVFPSTTDTFGNVVLESQASGLPVIVTDCGGPQENVIPWRTGLIVEGNSEESLMDGIQSLLSEPERLRAMGKAAREYAENRSFNDAFREGWELYAQTPGYVGNNYQENGAAQEVSVLRFFSDELFSLKCSPLNSSDSNGTTKEYTAHNAKMRDETRNAMKFVVNQSKKR